MLMFISSTLLRQGVCVCTICIDVKPLHCRGVWHSCPTTRNEAVGMSGGKLGRFPVPAILYYIYIVPPLGAFKSQLGGTYSILLLFYTVIDSCDYIIYIYSFVSSCRFCWVFARMIHSRSKFGNHFYTSVLLMSVRQDDMSPSGNPCPGSNL